MIVTPIAWRLAQARAGRDHRRQARSRPAAICDLGQQDLQVFDHLQDRNLELYEETLKEARSRFEPGNDCADQVPKRSRVGRKQGRIGVNHGYRNSES